MKILRDRAPADLVKSRAKVVRERQTDERRFFFIGSQVALVDLFPGRVAHFKGAEPDLDRLRKPDPDFRGRGFQGLAGARLGTFQRRMPKGRRGEHQQTNERTKNAVHLPMRTIGPSALVTPPLRSRLMANAFASRTGEEGLNGTRSDPSFETWKTPPSTGSLYLGSTTQSW